MIENLHSKHKVLSSGPNTTPPPAKYKSKSKYKTKNKSKKFLLLNNFTVIFGESLNYKSCNLSNGLLYKT
jgi:hypothetical protein